MLLPVAQVQRVPAITLADVLPLARWSVAERGVLLVVAAEKVRLPRGETLSLNPAFRDVLPRFGYKLVRRGGVWAIAPEQVQALPDWRGTTPEKLAAQVEHPLVGLFGALDKNGWKKTGSDGGLSRTDLPPKLQPFFDALFTEGTTLEIFDDEGKSKTAMLSPAERSGARLNIRWSNSWSLPIAGKDEFDHSTRESEESLPDSNLRLYRSPSVNLYSKQRRLVPNVGKTSDLDFEALDQIVSLEGVRTVKELTERLARATGLELYADARIEPLSVQLHGTRARAGEVLAALCLALGGAVRRLETAYVLTEERVPWAQQSIAQDEFFRRAEWLQQHGRQRLTERLQKDSSALRASISALPGEPHPDDVHTWQKEQDSDHFTTKQLPEAVQSRIREIADKSERPEKLGTDRVQLSPAVVFWLTIPGHGAVHFSIGDNTIENVISQGVLSDMRIPTLSPDPPELKKPVVWPAAWTTRIVRVAPTTPAEARELAQAAREAGMTDLWLDVPSEVKAATALVKAAAKSGLRLTLVIAPLARPIGTDGDGSLSDRLVTGETTDRFTARHNHSPPEGMYQEPETPRFLFPALSTIDPVIALVQLPEVRGIVLTESVRAGYVRNAEGLGIEGGYVPSLRLEFLRRWHTDPVDIVPAPYFDDDPEESAFSPFSFHPKDFPECWLQHRIRYAARWHKTLRTRLKLVVPKKPAFIGLRRYGNTDFCPWNNAEQIPTINDSKHYFDSHTADPNTSLERTKMFINFSIRSTKNTRFLLDLTRVNPREYLKQLKQR